MVNIFLLKTSIFLLKKKWFHFRCDLLKDVRIVVIDGRNVSGIDATVAKNLCLLRSDLESREQRIYFWNWNNETRKTLVAFDGSVESCFRNSQAILHVVAGERVSRFMVLVTNSERQFVPCQTSKVVIKVFIEWLTFEILLFKFWLLLPYNPHNSNLRVENRKFSIIIELIIEKKEMNEVYKSFHVKTCTTSKIWH